MAEICGEAADYLIDGSRDRTLFFGLVVWRPTDGTSARRWYFMVAGCDRTGEMRCDQLNAETEADSSPMRFEIAVRRSIRGMVVLRRPRLFFAGETYCGLPVTVSKQHPRPSAPTSRAQTRRSRRR